MPTLHADVLRVAVALDELFIRVMAEEARQRVADMRERSVAAEIRRSAPAQPLARFLEKPVVVDFVTPDSTPELGHDTLLDVLTCETATENGSGRKGRE